ncbi:hypothetical protein LCGC14_0294930 [marine sediment metagenome]|uniref:Uncharacterized protein n=1 Tax=marine sediment metagenome TaxID=412755 RepID=A0A0F9TS42_9ZZZZ
MPYERDVNVFAESQHGDAIKPDGTKQPVKATRDGAIFTADWYLKQLLRGRIHQVAGGATNQGITDPGTFGAGALDTTEFDLLVEVPTGTVIIPLGWTVVLEKFGATGLLEILLAWGTGAVSGGTDLTLVPVNQNLSSSKKSALTNNIVALAAASGTALTQEGEIWRDGLQLVEDIAANDNAAWPSRFQFKAQAPDELFVIEGPRFIAGWVSSVGATGFQKFTWAEFETGEDIG